MLTSPLSAVTLGALLEQEQQGLAQLLILLPREQTALTEGNIDEVSNCAAEKAVLMDCLNKIVGQRTDCIKSAGFGADPASMTRLFATHKDLAKVCYRLWSQVLASWQQAHKEHQLNETIAQIRLKQTERSLNVLHQAAGAPSGYGSDGRLQPPPTSRTVVQVR
ncbi:MAG: flagellar protein FlgN [Pseudomonadota bacterium]